MILPSPAYSEQDGLFANLEGRIQECRKASYPTNEAMEDWKIFNLLSNNLYGSNLFDNFSNIREFAFKEIPMFSGIDLLPKKNKVTNNEISSVEINEKIAIKPIDYYYSNAIARSSNTMNNNKKNGTNN